MGAVVRDKNNIPSVLAELQRLRRMQVRAGLFSSRCGADVVLYATVNEFGSQDGHVPERSFIRVAIARAQETIADLGADGVKAVLARKATAKDVLEKIGLFCQERIVSRINEQIPPPLAPSTVARKHSDKTLVDTGTMRKSVTYLVEGR